MQFRMEVNIKLSSPTCPLNIYLKLVSRTEHYKDRLTQGTKDNIYLVRDLFSFSQFCYNFRKSDSNIVVANRSCYRFTCTGLATRPGVTVIQVIQMILFIAATVFERMCVNDVKLMSECVCMRSTDFDVRSKGRGESRRHVCVAPTIISSNDENKMLYDY